MLSYSYIHMLFFLSYFINPYLLNLHFLFPHLTFLLFILYSFLLSFLSFISLFYPSFLAFIPLPFISFFLLSFPVIDYSHSIYYYNSSCSICFNLSSQTFFSLSSVQHLYFLAFGRGGGCSCISFVHSFSFN